jgi:uncharacterized membrane-anchored protein YjiN (DUF445 family)
VFRWIKATVLRLLHGIINAAIDRMSREEKEALLEAAIERVLNAMTPEERQQLVERMIPQLLEGVDMKEVFPDMFKAMWKNLETGMADAGFVDKMSKMASGTSEKIASILPEGLKKLLRENQEESS